jgi:large subunit ribosomal protein L4
VDGRLVTQRHPVQLVRTAQDDQNLGGLGRLAQRGDGGLRRRLVAGETPSTKAAIATLRKVTESRKVLVVLSSNDELNWVSLRNETTVHLIEAGQLNTYDVLVADEVVFTKEALDEFLGTSETSEEAGA